MNNLFASYMRTLTPYAVALLLTGTGWLGIPVDSTAAAGAVSLGLGAAYYACFRGLEALAERMSWPPLQLAAGLLLGWARPPAYGTGSVPGLSQQELAALRQRAGGSGGRE